MLIDFFLIKLHTCTYRHFRVVYTNLKEKKSMFSENVNFYSWLQIYLKNTPCATPSPRSSDSMLFTKMLRCFSSNSTTFALY